MTALGRRYLPTGSIVQLAKTQVYASLKQLTCQGWFAPEAMDGPLCGGTQLFVQTQQTVVGAHNVQCDGQLLWLGQSYLCHKQAFLFGKWGAAQGIKSTLAQHNDLRVLQQQWHIGQHVPATFDVGRPPRVYAHSIPCAVARCEMRGVAHPILWHANNGIVGLKIVCVKVCDVWHRHHVISNFV